MLSTEFSRTNLFSACSIMNLNIGIVNHHRREFSTNRYGHLTRDIGPADAVRDAFALNMKRSAEGEILHVAPIGNFVSIRDLSQFPNGTSIPVSDLGSSGLVTEETASLYSARE